MKRSLCLSAALFTLVGGLTALSLGGAAPVAPAALAVRSADPEPNWEKLLAEKAAAVVTIKCVMKFDMGGMGNDQEQEHETFGVMMDPKGVIMTSNILMGGMPGARARGMTVTPTKIKVLIGDDTEGVDAKLLARDSEMDLAWVQIEKPAEKPYAFVDFSKGAEAKIGDRLYVVDRLEKFFDRAPVIAEIRIGAMVKKPRNLLYPAEQLSRLGVGVFNAAGQVVGFATAQVPGEDEQEGGAMRRSNGAICVLPAADIITATARAKESAAADKKDEMKDEKKEEKPEEKKEEMPK